MALRRKEYYLPCTGKKEKRVGRKNGTISGNGAKKWEKLGKEGKRREMELGNGRKGRRKTKLVKTGGGRGWGVYGERRIIVGLKLFLLIQF